MRPRAAPSAPRTASSRRRAMPRARSRPATLTQAISSTSPAAAVSTSSAGRWSRTISSCSGTTRPTKAGAAFAARPAPGGAPPMSGCRRIASTSAAACAGDTPGRRRPSAEKANETASVRPSPFSTGAEGCMTMGVQSSSSGPGNANPSASTPTTVYGWPSSSIGAPAMSGSAAKRVVQVRKLSRTTRCAPRRASSSVKSRPSRGVARSSGKSDGETIAPRRLMGPSGPRQPRARGA